MSQATLERPAATKPAGKRNSPAADPRGKMIFQLSELLAGIVAMVEDEMGDCVGRVLEVAGGYVRRALGEFVESDSDTSYHTMLDADSFIQAAGALVAQEYNVSSKGHKGRTNAAETLVMQSDAIVNAMDQRLTDITGGKVAAIAEPDEVAAPAGADPAAEPDAPGVFLTTEAAHLVSNCTYQIETLILIMQDMARRADDDTTGVNLPIVVQALGVRIEQLNQCITDTVYPSPNGPSLADVRDKAQGQAPRLMQIKQAA